MKAHFEKVTSSIKSSFKASVYEDKNFDTPWHFHPEYELTFIVKGEGIRYVGNSVEKFEAGDFVLLGSNLPHCWKDSIQNNGNVKSLVFQWNDDILGVNWMEKNEFQNIKSLLKTALKGIKFTSNNHSKIQTRLSKIMNKSPFDKLINFIQFLEELSNGEFETLTTTDFTPSLNIKANNRIDKVYDYLQENYDKKIKLKDVSALVSMGDEAFCRFFKKSLNKSFFTFVNEYRINLACKELIETNKQVSQIAYDCGYESLPFFYRQFQKFMDCSPLVFKKMYLKVKST
ncbi:AraC family transcriptional regulator [Lutibacter citreus]|uniref:AraC family transcriptional regulator n=1 Tax=Lutibacter citreus TaxID=2138210 RepID=UPI000DBDFF66|nr:AraC family transcriptional regulator [Lutibacter citreus]